MLLVEREGLTRLLCIKSDPWFDREDAELEESGEKVFLFSGVLPKPHEHNSDGIMTDNVRHLARRFASDKIRSA